MKKRGCRAFTRSTTVDSVVVVASFLARENEGEGRRRDGEMERWRESNVGFWFCTLNPFQFCARNYAFTPSMGNYLPRPGMGVSRLAYHVFITPSKTINVLSQGFLQHVPQSSRFRHFRILTTLSGCNGFRMTSCAPNNSFCAPLT